MKSDQMHLLGPLSGVHSHLHISKEGLFTSLEPYECVVPSWAKQALARAPRSPATPGETPESVTYPTTTAGMELDINKKAKWK